MQVVGIYNHSRAALGSSKRHCKTTALFLARSFVTWQEVVLHLESSTYSRGYRIVHHLGATRNLVYTKQKSRYTSSNSTHELAKPLRLLRRPGNSRTLSLRRTITGPRDSFDVSRVTRQQYQRNVHRWTKRCLARLALGFCGAFLVKCTVWSQIGRLGKENLPTTRYTSLQTP